MTAFPLGVGARVTGALCAGLMLLAGASALANASDWAETPQGKARLITATSGVGSSETVRLGLEFDMEPGWKIYWRTPGDAGYPPTLDWSNSENLATTVMEWPVPERFEILGFETLGYKDSVVFPIEARLAEPGQALRLRASLDYLTCKDVCIPHTTDLSLDVPAGPAQNTVDAHRIEQGAARVPQNGEALGLAVERVAVADTESGGKVVMVTARSADGFSAPDAFVEGPSTVFFGRPEVDLMGGAKLVRLTLPADPLRDTMPELVGEVLTVTVVDGARALETTAVAEPGAMPQAGLSLLAVLGLALLGGLILNVMPCVLPVLSIKLLGVVRMGGHDAAVIRRGFLATAAGIVSTFLVLAAALAGLRGAGMAVGWGIQFQEPLFLAAMAFIVTVFAANLWGLFEIRLPGALGDVAVAGMNRADAHGGLTGSFAIGVLATVLATPCTAPFLGTAVGFALAADLEVLFAVFATLGVGLALPYLAVAAVPRLAQALPRPGRWMLWVKAAFGVLLAATAVWLLWVLAEQTGSAVAVTTGAAVALIPVGLWALRSRTAVARGATLAVLLAVTVSTPLMLRPDAAVSKPTAESYAEGIWRPFDRAAIGPLVADGKTVLVDVTADWCINCKVNKAVVLDAEPVSSRLAGDDVVAMVADWTRPDPAITEYLQEHGRYGIPFNVVYGPGAPGGIVLPEMLSQRSVTAALDRAAEKPDRNAATAGN